MHKEASMAKITRPTQRNVYQREQFFNILDKCREKPITWISAPPGAGKTTLISSYIESRKTQCLWYQLDDGDKDPATFFHYMGIAAAKTTAKKGNPLPHLTPEYLLGLKTFSREYFLELYKRLKRKTVIVFDNYQEVPIDSFLHDLIHEGLAVMPKAKDINIIIISRAVPPSILSRMRLNNLMEIITFDELRLTTDEVRGIASLKGVSKASNMEISNMLSRTEGWVAGLVLMLESGHAESFSTEYQDSYDSRALFDYFANKFFQSLNNDTRDFLLKMSVLPIMTSKIAKELTGNKRSGSIIAELIHKNYFIQSHQGDQTYYQFHALFREFLYLHLQKETSSNNLADLEQKAAKLLVDDGYIDDAVSLFRKASDWNSIASLICEKAPILLEQGRHQTIECWLNYLPEHVMKEIPWLLFWKGNSYLPYEQSISRQSFEMAFELFYNKKDSSGIFLSWAGIINATIHAFDDFKSLDHWIDLLYPLLKEFHGFPSKEIEDQVSFWMFVALSYRAPDHPNFNTWLDKAYSFLDETPDPNFFVQASLFLIDYFLWVGDLKKAEIITEKLSRITKKSQHSPLALISIKFAESLSNWYHGKTQCITTVSDALKIAEATGVNVFNYFLYGLGAASSLTAGDLESAEEYLKKAVSILDDKRRFCTSYYHHIVACHKLLKKDLAGSLAHEKLSMDLAIEVGSPFAEAMTRTGMALLSYEMGKPQKALDEITRARKLAVKTSSKLVEFVSYLFGAYFNLDRGKKNLAIKQLREAMALGSAKGLVNFHMWRPDIIARLCMLALEEEIEVVYVKRLVRERDLFPDSTSLEADSWPWRIKIYAMGQFVILKDGVPLQYSKKAPKKPIEMLKLLISLGGKDVLEERISDSLWQDAEGDSAHVAFTTTLKRLRHLLGVDDAILLHKSSLTLNPRYCWVDAWLFDDLIRKTEKCSIRDMDKISVSLLEKAVELCGKGFNIMSDAESSTIVFYERARSKFIRCAIKLGSYWEENGDIEKAIECYTKAIEIDILSEELYQKLMLCLYKHGQSNEALMVYKRLAEVCRKILGVEPSSETTRIYQSLLN